MTMLTDDVVARVTSYIQHQGTKSKAALADLVRTSQQRYVDAVAAVSDDIAAKKPAPDEWSIRELTRHVVTTQNYVAGLIWHSARSQEPPPRPGALGMTVDDDARPFAGWVAELCETNAKMLETILTLPDAPDIALKPAHPFFGPLNCREWAAFQRVHDEDHVQHAGKILAAVGG
jgi:hypothetical protein